MFLDSVPGGGHRNLRVPDLYNLHPTCSEGHTDLLYVFRLATLATLAILATLATLATMATPIFKKNVWCIQKPHTWAEPPVGNLHSHVVGPR